MKDKGKKIVKVKKKIKKNSEGQSNQSKNQTTRLIQCLYQSSFIGSKGEKLGQVNRLVIELEKLWNSYGVSQVSHLTPSAFVLFIFRQGLTVSLDSSGGCSGISFIF